jgi:ABC-type sugar transport system ATPase subunit
LYTAALALQFQQQKQNTNIFHTQDLIENNKSSSNYFLQQQQQQQEFFPLKTNATHSNDHVAQNAQNENNDLKGKHLNTNANILPPHIAMLLIDKLQQQLLEAAAAAAASASASSKQLNINTKDECNEDDDDDDEERLASVNEDENEQC